MFSLVIIAVLSLFSSVISATIGWSALDEGLNNDVRALAEYSGDILYAGGEFTSAGGSPANYIAAWNGSIWSALGDGMDHFVYALAVNTSGQLFAGGQFTTAGGVGVNHIARWDGSSWSALGGGVNKNVYAIAIDPDNNHVYAGGEFTYAGGNIAPRVAKWDGTSWSSLGIGMNAEVRALVVDSYGNVIAGGEFTTADGNAVNYIAMWDGTTWIALDNGFNGIVNALAIDASGNLYAAGEFTKAGDWRVNRIAMWDDTTTTWLPVSSGMNSTVHALTVDNSGNLYAGGSFITAGGWTVYRIAKWDGNTWAPLDSGTNDDVYALAKGSLYAAGKFTWIGGEQSNMIGVWGYPLPKTGFSPGIETNLPVQKSSQSYDQYNNVSLEIPELEIKAPIVGIPRSLDGWNLTWLDGQVGWLHDTAFPSWAGNSALTAHIYDANGQPGLFNNLEKLKFGDKVIVHAYGQAYTYEVRTVEKYINPEDTSLVYKHEEYPWLTLITCKGYDSENDSYRWRIVVRAVQTEIEFSS